MHDLEKVAFESRDGKFVFVRDPLLRGRYIRTDKSVLISACPFCGSDAGVPCKSSRGNSYSGSTHVVRNIKSGSLPKEVREEALRTCSQEDDAEIFGETGI